MALLDEFERKTQILTWALDEDLQVSAAGVPGVHLEVTDLFHPHP